MDGVEGIANQFKQLGSRSSVVEESWRITFNGQNFSREIHENIKILLLELDMLKISPQLLLDNDLVQELDDDENSFTNYHGKDWRLVVGKQRIAEFFPITNDGSNIIFFDTNRFVEWLKTLDPFSPSSTSDPDFQKSVVFRIYGISESFGGPNLSVLPTIADAQGQLGLSEFPSSEEVRSIVHIGTSYPIIISPRAFVLTWGKFDNEIGRQIMRLSALVMAASLSREIRDIEPRGYKVVISGAKKQTLLLASNDYMPSMEDYLLLCESVRWVYQERSETRHQLIMDRLSIDFDGVEQFANGLSRILKLALDQARDSYSFVILDRKDAYYKETREILKDLKVQSDLYAVKIRDLVSSLSRDLLGTLVFIGFSFISKFDREKLNSLINSKEFSIFTKTIAAYYLFSVLLQIFTHVRDSSLSYLETQKWLEILKGYTSRKDIEEKFEKPIKNRKTMFFQYLFFVAFVYLIMVVFMWNFTLIANRIVQADNVKAMDKDSKVDQGNEKPNIGAPIPSKPTIK